MTDQPPDHAWVVLQDHGPDGGGWGAAALAMPPVIPHPAPFVYTGNAQHVLGALAEICSAMADATGKETRLVRFTVREDVLVYVPR